MLKYTTDNVSVSLQRALADALKDSGYSIRWQGSGQVEVAPGTPRGVVTLVPEFPENPAFLVKSDGLNDGSIPKDEEIAVPAFALVLPTAPMKIRRVGIGHSDFERQRGFRVEGFAWDEFQQRELMDFFYDWLENGDVYLPVSDYSVPDSPVALEPARVVRAKVNKAELIHEVAAIRYYLQVDAVISYFE